ALDAAAAVVADDVGRNFVGDAEGEGGGMIGDEAGGLGDSAASVAHRGGVFEKAAVFVPGNVDEEVQIVLGGGVEQPARRSVIEAKRIGAQILDLREVSAGLRRRRKIMPVGICRKWAVSQAFGKPFRSAEAEEFAIGADAVAADRHKRDDTG